MSPTVNIDLEIAAEVPAGVLDNVVRIVTENGRTLKFTSQGFERVTEMNGETHSQLANFIWSICNLLRGPYKAISIARSTATSTATSHPASWSRSKPRSKCWRGKSSICSRRSRHEHRPV